MNMINNVLYHLIHIPPELHIKIDITGWSNIILNNVKRHGSRNTSKNKMRNGGRFDSQFIIKPHNKHQPKQHIGKVV